MGFLDQKERILDIVLTDKGRDLLSKNQLKFAYYAFSDDGIDYSGSLSSSTDMSSTMDNYIRRNLPMEASQMFQSVPAGAGGFSDESFGTRHKDLRYFLYTNPSPNIQVLPDFALSAYESSSITLERRYFVDTITLDRSPKVSTKKPYDVIVRAKVPKGNSKKRKEKYVSDQRVDLFISKKLKDKGENNGK